MTCFPVRDSNILSKQELHRSLQVARNKTLSQIRLRRPDKGRTGIGPRIQASRRWRFRLWGWFRMLDISAVGTRNCCSWITVRQPQMHYNEHEKGSSVPLQLALLKVTTAATAAAACAAAAAPAAVPAAVAASLHLHLHPRLNLQFYLNLVILLLLMIILFLLILLLLYLRLLLTLRPRHRLPQPVASPHLTSQAP